jgi:hypothetical protein
MSLKAARKLEIFVGATRRDLGPARAAVINAILETGHIPSGMELWAAGNSPPLDVIAEYLERCDAHILVVGARYGKAVPGHNGMSYTEWELRQSKDKRPILTFVYDAESLKQAREQEIDDNERKEDQIKRLDDLRTELLDTKYVKEFSIAKGGVNKLQRDVILAIDDLLQSSDVHEDAGWIRGDSDAARTARDIANNPFLDRELTQLRRFSTLGSRVGLDTGSKEAVAKAFWWHMKGRIRRRQYKTLFFESGSTCAYLSDEFVKTVVSEQDGSDGWHIRTNNVLSLIHFDLHTSIDAARFPGGIPDPEDKYGAIFPSDWKNLHEPYPDVPRDLYDGERKAVAAIRKAFRQLAAKGDRSAAHRRSKEKTTASMPLVFAAASGLDLTNSTEHFRGPHVGSHPNMLFKRAIFASACPVVLCVSAEKLGNPFRHGRCYPVFGPDEPWANAVKRYPIAVCVGYEWPKVSEPTPEIPAADLELRNRPDYITECLTSLGFTLRYFHADPQSGQTRPGTGALMYANEKFERCIPR